MDSITRIAREPATSVRQTLGGVTSVTTSNLIHMPWVQNHKLTVRRNGLGNGLVVAFLTSFLWFLTSPAAELLPIEDFCRPPTLNRVRLSPLGRHMAAITSEHGKQYILLSDLVSGKLTRLPVPRLLGFQWLTEERLLCHSGGTLLGEMFAVNIDGTQTKVLVQPILTQLIASKGFRGHIFEVLGGVPRSESVLVADYLVTPSNLGMYPHPDVQRLNYFTGALALEEKNPGNVVKWLVDNEGIVRAGILRDKDTVQLLYRHSKTEPWAVVHTSTRDESDLLPVRFGAGGELYVFSHNGGDVLGLYTFDLEAKRVDKCLCRDEQFDLVTAAFSPTGTLLGAFCEAERIKFKPVDEEYRKVQARLDAAMPETINLPVSMSVDGAKILYRSFSDRDPGAYYLVDPVKNEFGIIGRSASWLKPELMAAVQPIEYAARDGLTIHGYLTIPPGAAATNLPLIIMPHGGPAARDSWRYEPEVQFLANRGYAVLQVNFRGSAGYGLKFLRAGFKEWGGKMQDDITDAVHWAVARGLADGHRVGIFGASYGGYAALMGLIATPDLFRCAICYAGVTDVRSITQKSSLRGQFREDFEHITREHIGDYRADKRHLQEISPVNLADKIQAPILLAYGARDPIVDIEQGRTFAKALKKNKKEFELIVEENEGHGFTREGARSNLLFRIELFLNKNLSE